MRVRLNTNGLGSHLAGRNIAPELSGLVDEVRVSLNAPDARTYQRLTKSEVGEAAYGAVVSFARAAAAAGLQVIVTAVNCPGIDVRACLKAAQRLNLEFRSRKYRTCHRWTFRLCSSRVVAKTCVPSLRLTK